ncbi:hypothetical protein [Escherichia coli]
MTLDEKISQLEKKLAELSSPPIAIEHTAVEIEPPRFSWRVFYL